MQPHNIREALRLGLTTNLSNRRIGRLVHVAHPTVGKYRRRALEAGLSWEHLEKLNDAELLKIFKKPTKAGDKKRLPDWSEIRELMQKKHQTLMQLWEEYATVEPETAYSYSQFTQLYRQYIGKLDLSMRQVHYAGECVFVDFSGKRISWRASDTGEEHWAEIFVSAAGCSNYTFAYAVQSQSTRHWIQCHNAMFAFYGGVFQVIVPDNLKAAVITPGRFPGLNRTYADLARHYGCVIDPARVRKPQDKSKAEAAVLMVARWITAPLCRRQFFSIEEINAAIAELLEKLNQREFKRLPGCRRSRFEDLDKPALKSLPERPFEHAEWVASQKVGPDYHVYVNNHAYSVPFRLVAASVEARVTDNAVEMFHNGSRVASHVRSEVAGEHTTNPNHRPVRHQVYAEQSLEHFRAWARGIGEAAVMLIEAQFSSKPAYSMVARKASSQLKQLARHHGEGRFEAACARAVAIQSPTVKSVRSILQNRLDEALPDDVPLQPQLPLHQNVRGAAYFAEGDAHAS